MERGIRIELEKDGELYNYETEVEGFVGIRIYSTISPLSFWPITRIAIEGSKLVYDMFLNMSNSGVLTLFAQIKNVIINMGDDYEITIPNSNIQSIDAEVASTGIYRFEVTVYSTEGWPELNPNEEGQM